LVHELETRSAGSVVRWAVEKYAPRLVVSCSFGGPTSMVIVDMLMAIDRSIPVTYLDTGLLFDETYALVDRVAEHYGIVPVAIQPEQTVTEQNATHGEALWARDPQACCALRKVEPQRASLRSYDAWITGLRRNQASTRAAEPIVEWDERFELVKINPLVTWDDASVWRYLEEHEVPYNPLLASGYSSIGCRPCTRAVAPGEDARAGRWSAFAHTECGLHARPVGPT
jgi:phosphoadenosine phosphosulfate reductase